MFVKIVKLPRFRAVSFHVRESETPEHDAWEQLESWIKPRGLLDNPTAHPIFGRNNPTPMEQRRLRGYEFLIPIPDDYPLEPGTAELTFPGGLFAAVQSKGIPQMIENYEKIFAWIEASAEYTPDYPEGYDFDHSPGLELEQNLNSSIEGENEIVMEVYVPIKRR